MDTKAAARHLLPDSFYIAYRQRKVQRLRKHYAPRVVTHTYGGHKLTIRLTDAMAESWYDHDWPQLQELVFLTAHGAIGTGATIFDIGAHHGIVALMLAHAVGPRGRVIAIEGEEVNAAALRRNVTLNDARNVTVVNAVAAADNTPVHFAVGLNGRVEPSSARAIPLTPAVTVDDLSEEYGLPDVVFIDVEGFEEKVLEGAQRTLEARSTSFCIEVHESLACYGGTPQSLLTQFRGFETYAAVEGQPFAVLTSVPSGRFFLLACPAVRSVRQPPSATSPEPRP